jgi:Protein of unknown function (DUF742)
MSDPPVRQYDRWLDREAGPVVRPYALTGGRTAPAGGPVLDLISVVSAFGPPAAPADSPGLSPEHRKLIKLCQEPSTVADIAADISLPLGVVRVLLADLIAESLIAVHPGHNAAPQASHSLLKEVLDGLRSL